MKRVIDCVNHIKRWNTKSYGCAKPDTESWQQYVEGRNDF